MKASRKKRQTKIAAPTESAAATGVVTRPAKAKRDARPEPLISPGKQERLVVAGILAIIFLAYFNSLGGQFVYDDRVQILRNPTILSLANIPSMFTQSVWQFIDPAPGETIGTYYRPLFNILLAVNYNLFGPNVVGWHVVSVLLHLAVTLLVYMIARRWGLARELAAVAALFFGLHPTHSESVAWISGVPDPMAGVFLLLSLLFYERYYRIERASSYWLIASLAMALAAMLSKEVTIMLPALIAAREVFDRSEGEKLSATISRIAGRVVPFVAVAIFYLAARYYVMGFISQADPKAAHVTTLQWLMTIPSVLLTYARLLFFPFSLSIIYNNEFVTSAGDVRFWGSALAVAVIVGASIWIARSSAIALRALALLLLFLLPVMNLKAFNPEESLLHDRYLYLPSIGFSILLALGLNWMGSRFASKQLLMPAVAVIGLIMFGMTFYQNYMWKDDQAMAAYALNLSPQKPFLHNYAGADYSLRGELAEAEKYYMQAISLRPNYFDSLSNLGDVYMRQKRYLEAAQYYQRAVESGAPYSQTNYNLADALVNQKRLAEAEQPLLRTIEIQPSYAEAHFYLGWLYQQLGKMAQAEPAYLNAILVKPSYPEPRINLATVLSQQGRLKEALDHLEYVRRIAPDHPVMLYTLGDVYLKSNRPDDGIAAFTQLLRREPGHRMAHTGIGLCYEKAGNIGQAKVHFGRAIEIAPTEEYTKVAREHLAKLK
jgi:protein O-mannosyl-transferase